MARETSACDKEAALQSRASNAASKGFCASPATVPQSERRDGIVEMTLGTWRISVERIAPTEAELAAMYDETAESWHDRLALLGYPQAYEDLFDRLLANGALNSLWDGGSVLDFGVGTAAFSLALAGKVAAPLRIEGVDLSPSMLLRASLRGCYGLSPRRGFVLYRGGVQWSATSRGNQGFEGYSKTTKGYQRSWSKRRK